MSAAEIDSDGLPTGWLTLQEAGILAEYAAGKVVLEIGAWLGRSTVAMARVAKLVVSVDHHHGPPYDGQGDTFGRFAANLQRLEIRNVVPILAASEVALPLLATIKFDMAFIDGAHEADSVIRDAKGVWRLVRDGGWVIFHDYGNHDGVVQGVNEFCWLWDVHHERRAESLALIQR